jgi:hypothetical protein
MQIVCCRSRACWQLKTVIWGHLGSLTWRDSCTDTLWSGCRNLSLVADALVRFFTAFFGSFGIQVRTEPACSSWAPGQILVMVAQCEI